VGRQPGRNAHPRSPLHARGALPRRQAGGDRSRLQPDSRPRRLLAEPPARHRRGPRPGHGPGDHGGGALRRRVRPRADRPAGSGSRGQRALPAGIRPPRGRQRRDPLLLGRSEGRARHGPRLLGGRAEVAGPGRAASGRRRSAKGRARGRLAGRRAPPVRALPRAPGREQRSRAGGGRRPAP
jgi:hypothetical protein